MSVAAMLSAAVAAAGVTSLAMLVVVVVTVNIGIIAQISAEQCVHRRVSFPADTAIELNSRFGQCCLGTAADATADQSVHAVLHQEACQCAVTAAVGIHNFRMEDLALRSLINLELLGVTEMLKNLAVFVGNCNFHLEISFVIVIFFCIGFWSPTAATALGRLLPSADAVASAGDVQRFSVDKACRNFTPRAFINFLHC